MLRVFNEQRVPQLALASSTRHPHVCRGRVVAAALPKRRRQPPKKVKKEPKPLSDEELLRELNSTHLWLSDGESDFGLEDVAAHAATRNQAQRVDFTSSRSKGGSSGSRRGSNVGAAPSDPQTLSDIDPTSGQPLPDWISDLQQAGFDVMDRDGQLFMQRGTLSPQPTPPQQRQQQQALPSAAAATSRNKQQVTAQAAAATAAVPGQQFMQVSDKSLSVRHEFDAAIWQQHILAVQDGSRTSSSSSVDSTDADNDDMTAAGAWYTSPAHGTATADTNSSSSSTRAPAQQQHPVASAAAAGSGSSSSRNSSSRVLSAAAIQRALLSCRHPRALLALLQRVFPAWCANGCWLVAQSGVGVVAAPTPAEASTCIKGVALAARKARLNTVQLHSLAREPLVVGLVEALRLTPPRVGPNQPPDLSQRLWSLAKTYWMQAGTTTAAAAQQQLLTRASLPQPTSPDTAQQQQQQLLGLSGGVGGPPAAALGTLLVQLQSRGGGGGLSKQQLAAAAALVMSASEDALHRTAVVSGLWGLSVLGGALFFQQEMEALCRIAQAKFSRWQPRPSELSDVLWALAHARHWSSLLSVLEGCLMDAGGPTAATAPEAVTTIWACAVLGHTPKQLLNHLDTHGWVVRTNNKFNNNTSSSSSSSVTARSQPVGGASGSSAGIGSSTGSSSALGALRDSQLCTLAWSLACLQAVDGGLFKAVWCEVCRRGQLLSADVKQAVQLAQVDLAIQLEASYASDELCPGEGTQALLSAVRGIWRQQGAALQAEKAHSSYQRSIAATLARLRVMHVLEDTSTGYAVDITIPSLRVAVEADGPSHFSRTAPPRSSVPLQLGATAMKRRHLQGLGWSVVNVPYTDWDKLTDEQQKVTYLKQRIAEAKRATAAGGIRAVGAADQGTTRG